MEYSSIQPEDILKLASIKKSYPRLATLELFIYAEDLLSAKDIFEELQCEGVDLVTVYRVLETFSEKGLIRRVDLGGREAQYELIDARKDHHHVICLECKKVSEFTGCDSKDLISKALKQVKDFKLIMHHSFDLFGVCNACSKK